MRGKIRVFLIVCVVLLTAMACQPANKPWLPDGVHPQPPKVAESEIVEKFLVEFNPGQALVDAADSSRSDIYYKDGDAPAVSSARSAHKGIVYRYVYFDGYKQDSMDLILSSGYMLFIINGNTAGTGKTGYTISVPEGIEVETLSGQVVSDFVVEDVSSTTAAITAVEVDGEGNISITINEKDFSELPPSTTASTPGMNGESISKGELEEFTEIQIEPEDGVKNLDVNSIIIIDLTFNSGGKFSLSSKFLAPAIGNIMVLCLLKNPIS